MKDRIEMEIENIDELKKEVKGVRQQGAAALPVGAVQPQSTGDSKTVLTDVKPVPHDRLDVPAGYKVGIHQELARARLMPMIQSEPGIDGEQKSLMIEKMKGGTWKDASGGPMSFVNFLKMQILPLLLHHLLLLHKRDYII
jgi:hypothetical protein